MLFEWVYDQAQPQLIRDYLRELGLPRSFVTHLKQAPGLIRLNQEAVTVRARIHSGDILQLDAPSETGHDTVIPSYEAIDIIYEDRDVLVVNKPADLVSIPSRLNPASSMANRVKGYYIQQGYDDQVIHIVTRLDRDTTGLMLIAKHRLAHALLDRQIQAKQIEKIYWAISSRVGWPDHGLINQPIARHDHSIITRQVHESGQAALTEYWVEDRFKDSSLLKLQLHTGRTHQIRVHLTYEGGPLVGDDLYGGPLIEPLNRQALHCGQLNFSQPFSQERIQLSIPLAQDMAQWCHLRK
ncbi:RluA family pseudouridine synthase [Vaginisenegalia massiliensis]|uniref:RluA family pseudouridine synthase n=1 Tax=Vaginisenegalia massiliensis TaxID=2058294 RepID=UPI000F5207C0|nr:RluA family pseudouridine synthase [Vaginisenegalia massiliensis]